MNYRSPEYFNKTLTTGGCIFLNYIPAGKYGQKYEVISVVKVKQEDGSWEWGLHYKKGCDNYVRTFSQFPKEKWSYEAFTGNGVQL